MCVRDVPAFLQRGRWKRRLVRFRGDVLAHAGAQVGGVHVCDALLGELVLPGPELAVTVSGHLVLSVH